MKHFLLLLLDLDCLLLDHVVVFTVGGDRVLSALLLDDLPEEAIPLSGHVLVGLVRT